MVPPGETTSLPPDGPARKNGGEVCLPDLVKFSGVGQPTTTRLSVAGNGTGSPLKGRVLVTPTSADRFIAPSTWSHRGTYLFHNVADTIHFMAIQPVEAGTTDPQIQAFFDSGNQTRRRALGKDADDLVANLVQVDAK